jgi:hypothetical protein
MDSQASLVQLSFSYVHSTKLSDAHPSIRFVRWQSMKACIGEPRRSCTMTLVSGRDAVMGGRPELRTAACACCMPSMREVCFTAKLDVGVCWVTARRPPKREEHRDRGKRGKRLFIAPPLDMLLCLSCCVVSCCSVLAAVLAGKPGAMKGPGPKTGTGQSEAESTN